MEKCTYCAMSLVSYAQIQRQALLWNCRNNVIVCWMLVGPRGAWKNLEFTNTIIRLVLGYEVKANIGKFLLLPLWKSNGFKGRNHLYYLWYEVEADLDEKQHTTYERYLGKCTRRIFRGMDLVPTLIYYIYQALFKTKAQYWKIW